MKRYCPYCESLDSVKAKIVKLASPVEEDIPVGGGLYACVVTHRCESCGCSFGEGKSVGELEE